MLDRDPATIDQDFEYAKICVDILCTCSTAEPVAAKHLGLIQPLYDALVDKHKRMQNQAANTAHPLVCQGLLTPVTPPHTKVSALSDSSHAAPVDTQAGAGTLDAEVVSIVKKLSDLLADPFSMGLKAKIQGVRETRNAVGTYSVLWWE